MALGLGGEKRRLLGANGTRGSSVDILARVRGNKV
jgi:hypothetical protein